MRRVLRLVGTASLALGVASAVWWSDVPPLADAGRASGPSGAGAPAVPVLDHHASPSPGLSEARAASSPAPVQAESSAPPTTSGAPVRPTVAAPPTSKVPPRQPPTSPPTAPPARVAPKAPPTVRLAAPSTKPALLLPPGDPLASTVLVEATGCRRGIASTGSGVVLGGGLIVTNAHVIAGQQRVTVWGADGRSHVATVVGFDPVADLAALVADGLGAEPLRLARPVEGAAGRIAGHPGGGTLSIAPFVVGATRTAPGTDIYGAPSPARAVLSGRAPLEHGDSGAPLILPDGSVGGIVYAASSDDLSEAWLVTADDVSRFLAGVANGGGRSVGTGGRCLS